MHQLMHVTHVQVRLRVSNGGWELDHAAVIMLKSDKPDLKFRHCTHCRRYVWECQTQEGGWGLAVIA